MVNAIMDDSDHIHTVVGILSDFVARSIPLLLNLIVETPDLGSSCVDVELLIEGLMGCAAIV